ncbi:MAG: YhbD family protein [Turicibacter sp.]|nr:YhbD family protein [Turicibacter sp.]
MSDELISKKDLLLVTGISYGQLYRWKRKNLIPEEWFIRKSAYTGQETFFPRAEILERVAKIQSLKDTVSLDELAAMFSPGATHHTFESSGSAIANMISPTALNLYLEETGFSESTFNFDQMLGIYLLETLLKSGDIGLDEGRMVVGCLKGIMEGLSGRNTMLLITRKLGVSTVLFLPVTEEVLVDDASKIVVKIALPKIAQELKEKVL